MYISLILLRSVLYWLHWLHDARQKLFLNTVISQAFLLHIRQTVNPRGAYQYLYPKISDMSSLSQAIYLPTCYVMRRHRYGTVHRLGCRILTTCKQTTHVYLAWQAQGHRSAGGSI